MRLAVKLSLSAEHSRAFNKRTCGNVVRIPGRANPSRYPPGQIAILELDQFSSAQMISTTIGILLLVGLTHLPKSSRYVRLRRLFRWSVGPCSSVIRFLDVLRERLSHISGQEQGYFRKILQPIDSIEHGLLFGLFLALH